MEEVWKDIKGYEGLYQVSNMGRVRSLDRYVNHNYVNKKLIKSKIRKFSTDKDGYKGVTLCKDGIQKTYKVHRLVAEAFLQNPNNLPFINHKDEDKTNNRVDNLEWCTHSYNINYGTRNKKVSTHFSKPVLQFTKDGEFIKEYKSVTSAEKQNLINHISCCCLGKLRHAGGYVWRFKEKSES